MDLAQVSSPSDSFCNQLTECLPHMRAFARFLCRNNDMADDLVQDASVRALMAAHQFKEGSNFKAWVFTIIHNQHISNYRRKQPLVGAVDIAETAACQIAPNQIDSLLLKDLDRAVRKLPQSQQKALILIVVHGLSYEAAAQVCQCAVGTIKSRVGRARSALHEMMMAEPKQPPRQQRDGNRAATQRRLDAGSPAHGPFLR